VLLWTLFFLALFAALGLVFFCALAARRADDAAFAEQLRAAHKPRLSPDAERGLSRAIRRSWSQLGGPMR
jgi:hypothetical protein